MFTLFEYQNKLIQQKTLSTWINQGNVYTAIYQFVKKMLQKSLGVFFDLFKAFDWDNCATHIFFRKKKLLFIFKIIIIQIIIMQVIFRDFSS